MKHRANTSVIAAAVVAAALLLSGCGGDSTKASERAPSRNATPIPAASGTNGAVAASTPEPGQAPAPTALDAVTRYLDAEARGDFDASWALLSAADREDIGSATAWDEQHAVLPRTTFSSVVANGSDAPVVTEVTFEPRVDETVGVVAGSARVTWATIQEAGGFVIDRSETKVEAHYPADTLAATDVLTWLDRIRSGEPPVGYGGSLLGQPSLVDELKDATGTFRTGDMIELDEWATPDLVTNAFGPGAATWARVVHVDGPVPFDAVAAPYGDRWVVVGLVGT